jgi:hypothetical protein
MRKIFLFFVIVFCLQFASNAQYNTVEKIRAYYTKVNTEINAAIKNKVGKYCNEISVNTTKASWPAVGNSYQKKISVWYSDDPVSHGDDNPDVLLDKVNIAGEIAGNKYTEEYLFANGELLFYCFFDTYKYNGTIEKDEYRVYFNRGKVLKYDVKMGGHNEITREQADVQTEAYRYGKIMMQLFLNSCGYIPN